MNERRRILVNSGMLTLSANSGTANASGGNVSFKVNWNGELLKDSSVSVFSNQTWATPTWTASTSTVKVTCTRNTDIFNTRNATITVSYGGTTASYLLTQNQGDWSLSNTYEIVFFENGSTSISIQANGSTYSGTNYTVSESESWITTSTSGGTITINYTANTGSDLREGTITVTLGGQSKNFILRQISKNDLADVRFADGRVYSQGNWPSNGTPIGVVVPEINACVSLRYMSCKTPDVGGNVYVEGTSLKWGGYNYDVSTLTNYPNTEAVLSDMDGKSNTAKILAIDNSNSTAWQTASTINNAGDNQYIHPAALCCWRYHTAGTNQGDWYLPSIGEYYKYMQYYESSSKMSYAHRFLNEKYGVDGNWMSLGSHITSTENSGTSIFRMANNRPDVIQTTDKDDSCLVRAFLQL